MGQAGAAFDTAAVENPLAGLSSHALHETVLLRALAFFGLKCSFGHMKYLSV